MSITVTRNNRLPLLGGKLKNGGNLVCPPLKKSLMPRPADQFNTKKVRNEDVQLVLKFLRECFDFAPTITPADTVCKLRLKMSSADHKIKRMKDQLLDHDVLLFDVQEELNLGPETNPVRTARAFKTYVRASKDRATRLEKTNKGNETVLKVCKEIAGVSGKLAPEGLADLLNSTWSKQQHVISQLKNKTQNLKEQGPTLPKKDSLVGQPDELILGLARIMDVDINNSLISTVVGKMKSTFMDMKDDIISLKDTVKVKDDTIQELQNQLRNRSRLQPLKPLVTSRDEYEIQNLRDREKTKTKRIVELQNELEDVKTKNLDLTLDLQEAQDQRQIADNRVFDFESKIRDLEVDIEKKASEIEELLQRYEEAGEVVASLQTELDQTKQNNDSINAEIKTLQSREFKKDDRILKLEKDLANFQQKKESDFKLENGMAPKFDQSALQLQKNTFDEELKNLRSNGYQRDDHVLKLERDIANMQKEKYELYQQIQNSFSKDFPTNHRDQVLKLKQEVEDLKEQKIELELKLKDTISQSDADIFELNQTISDVQVQKIELDSKLKDVGEKYSETKDRFIQLEKDVADLQSQKNEVDSDNQHLSNEISEQKAEKEQLMTEEDELMSNFKEVEEKYSEAKDHLNHLQKEGADLQSQKVETDSENQRLSNLVSEYGAGIKQLMSEKEELMRRFKRMIDRRFESIATAEQQCYCIAGQLRNMFLVGMKAQHDELTELKSKLAAKETQQTTEEIEVKQSDKKLDEEKEIIPADQAAEESHQIPVPQDLKSKDHEEEIEKYPQAKDRLNPKEVADLQRQKINDTDSENQHLSKLISKYEADIKQLMSEKEQLKTHYEDMIDRRFEKFAAAEQHANQKSRDLADAVYQKLAGRMKAQLKEQLIELKAKKAKETKRPTEETEVKQSEKKLEKEKGTIPADHTANESHLMSVPQDLKSKDKDLKESVPDANQAKYQLQALVDSLAKEKDLLSVQLKVARQEYQVLEDQFESVNEEGETHQALAQQFSQEKEQLSKQLADALQQCKDLEEKLSAEKQEKYQHQTDDLSAQVMKAQQQYQELKERFATELEGVTEARQELTKSAAKERDDLKTELAQARKQYEESQERMQRFQSIGDDLAEENYKISAEIGMACRDYQELNDKFKAAKEESEKQVSQLHEENDYLLSELATLRNLTKESNDKFKAAKEESEKQVSQLQEENDYLLSELATLRNLTKDLQESLKYMTERNEKLNLEVSEQEGKDDELFEELESSLQQCQDLEDKSDRETLEFQEEAAKWEKEKANLLKQLESRESICQETNSRPAEISGATNKLEEQIAKLQKERKELEEKLQTAETKLEDLEEKSDRETLEFQEEAAKWEKEKANLMKQLESRQVVCQEANSRSTEITGASNKLEEQLAELQKDRKELEEKLQTAETKLEDLEEKSARETLEFQKESGKLEKEKANLLKQLESRQIVCQQFEEYLAAATEENERHMTLAAKLKEENTNLSRQIAQANKQSQQESNTSAAVVPHTKVEKPDEQREELQNRKKELEKKLNKAENECSILTMRSQTATSKIRELEKLLKEAQEKINKLEIEIKEVNSRPAENPGATEELEEQIAELQKGKKELEDKLQTVETERKELTEKEQTALEKVKELEDLKKEVEAKNKKLEFDIKLTKKKVETAFSMADDYKADIADMKVHHRGLQNQVDFQKKKNEELEGQVSQIEERNDLLEEKLAEAEKREKEMEELKGKASEVNEMRELLEMTVGEAETLEKEQEQLEWKVSEMKELRDLLQAKLTEAETRENETENKLQAMRATLTTAAVQFGLLTKVGDELTITDLCQSLDDMRQLNAHMKLEINDLEKAKADLEEMIKTGDCLLESGDSGDDKSVGEREKYALKETVEDLRFQTYKQEHLIKKLRYQVSEFHQFVLNKKDSMFDDMPYIDRAVVMRIYSDVELKIINAADLSFLPESQLDDDEGEIGKGAFGKVFLRQYQGEAVAVKVPYISERVKDEDAEKRRMRIKANHARTTMEYVVHLALDHHSSFPKTVGIVDFDGAPSLVLEFLGNKETGAVFSLGQAIKYPSPSLRREDWFGIIMDIVDGMKAMHLKGLLHNDLKPNNVLLQWDYGDKRWHAFIIDMGKVSTQTIPLRHRHIPEDETEGYKDGTMYQHLAPEYILDRQPMSIQTEIYSVGKILSRIEGKVIKSRTLRDLAAEMTNIKPRLRPSWKHIEKAIAKAQKKSLS